jgi:hypothetical protein
MQTIYFRYASHKCCSIYVANLDLRNTSDARDQREQEKEFLILLSFSISVFIPSFWNNELKFLHTGRPLCSRIVNQQRDVEHHFNEQHSNQM